MNISDSRAFGLVYVYLSCNYKTKESYWYYLLIRINKDVVIDVKIW